MKSALLRGLKFLLLTLAVVSCVGTIEDTDVQKSKTLPTDPPPIPFDGVSQVIPISNDKVEVYFFPAPGDAEQLIYEINYDGLTTPIAVPGINLSPEYRGYLVHTLTGLATDATYNFEVQVKNKKTGARSISDATVSASTYGNVTCNFLGIQNVATMPGLAGINSVKVEWVEAEKKGTIFIANAIDADQYVVTLVDADILSPGDIKNDNFSEPIRKRVFVSPSDRATVVGGLQEDTEYYVHVGCVHHDYTIFGSDVTYKKEENNKYMDVKTLSGNISNLDFDSDGLNLTLSDGEAGLTSMLAQWVEAEGAFDHYRVYYTINGAANLYGHTPEPICDGSEVSTDPNVFCKQVAFDKVSSILLDLAPNTVYDVMVAVCQSLDCDVAFRRTTNVKSIETTPPVAAYSGILSIDPAKSFSGISNLHLNVNLPDLSTGIMDGIIIEYYDPVLDADIPLNNPDFPVIPPHIAVRVEDFNFETDNEYVVTNVDPFSADPYCFYAYPYTVVGGAVVPHDGGKIQRCIVPSINPPDDKQFSGAINCSTSGNNLTVEWLAPTEGVFSHYEIFIRDDASIFEYGVAIGGNPAYQRNLVTDTNLNTTFEGLPSGTTFRAGVLTYVNLYGTILRSTFNSGVVSCTIP